MICYLLLKLYTCVRWCQPCWKLCKYICRCRLPSDEPVAASSVPRCAVAHRPRPTSSCHPWTRVSPAAADRTLDIGALRLSPEVGPRTLLSSDPAARMSEPLRIEQFNYILQQVTTARRWVSLDVALCNKSRPLVVGRLWTWHFVEVTQESSHILQQVTTARRLVSLDVALCRSYTRVMF